jgi:hypothetical protein
MVADKKNLKRGVAAAGRRKSDNGGSKSGFDGLRFGPESPSPPLIRGGGRDRRRGGDRNRGRGGGDRSRSGWQGDPHRR